MKILNYRRQGKEWAVVRHQIHHPSIERVDIVKGSYRGDLNYLDDRAVLLKYVLTCKNGDIIQGTKYLIDNLYVPKEIFLTYISCNVPATRNSFANH